MALSVLGQRKLEIELNDLHREKKALQAYDRGNDSLALMRSSKETYDFSKIIGQDTRQAKPSLETEISSGLTKVLGPSQGTWVPMDALCRSALNASSDSQLITQNATGSELLPYLRPRSVCLGAGATLLTGLKSSMSIPRPFNGWVRTLEHHYQFQRSKLSPVFLIEW